MIQLSTFFSGLGITSGNTEATNFYEFWKGIVMNGETEINDITGFMSYLGTTRYEFFKNLNSEYPDVWDEYTFYKNIDDNRIYDFYTFYKYAGEYFTTTPSSFAFNYAEWAIPDCSQSSPPNTFYCSNEYPVVDDIIYSDSSLTTPFVGLGGGAYYTFNIEGSFNIYSCEIDTDGTILTISYCANYTYEICLASTAEDACNYPFTCSDFGYYWFNNSSPQVGDRVYYNNGVENVPVSYVGETLYFGIPDLGKVYEFDGDTAVILSVNDCV